MYISTINLKQMKGVFGEILRNLYQYQSIKFDIKVHSAYVYAFL